MTILDYQSIKDFDGKGFLSRDPYPWANPSNLVSPLGLRELRENLPNIDLFKSSFGRPRKHGQASHDRYVLKYADGLDVPKVWQDFIGELRGETYSDFVRQAFDVKRFQLNFFWFFTPAGCSVSPHCDHFGKVGVHIFYLNDDTNWDKSWGGETLILGADQRLKRASAPAFEDFSYVQGAETSGTHSLLFKRTSHSWHGVREISCPEGYFRRVFMVSIAHSSKISKYYNALFN